jgi:probable F420-dependent oxidoreductase
LKIGVHLANARPWATADSILTLGMRAETLGFDSLWVSDQVVIPGRVDSWFPYSPTGVYPIAGYRNIFEAFSVLAVLAGRTNRVQLGTSVLVLPQRQPLVVAKQWATLDALSGGRLILGVGTGFMREQFEALGADTFERRGQATDEAIRMLRAVWAAEGEVSFAGVVYRFAPLWFLPKPAQRAGPPIWIGGLNRRAIRRAAELGDGWHVVATGLDQLRRGVAELHALLERFGRAPADVTISGVLHLYRPGDRPDPATGDFFLYGSAEQIAARVRAYHDAGMEYVILNAESHETATEMFEAIEFFASEVRPILA